MNWVGFYKSEERGQKFFIFFFLIKIIIMVLQNVMSD